MYLATIINSLVLLSEVVEVGVEVYWVRSCDNMSGASVWCPPVCPSGGVDQ
jgi:hypothetical protein